MWKTYFSVEISKRIDVNKSVDNLFFLSTPVLKSKGLIFVDFIP